MKKLICLTFIFSLLVSCSVQKYGIVTYGIDLSRFSDKGFLISTTDINQNYKSVAIVTSKCVSGSDKGYSRESNDKSGDAVYSDPLMTGNYRACALDDVLDEVYKQCVDLGANGVIQLEIFNELTGITVNGLAVKIE